MRHEKIAIYKVAEVETMYKTEREAAAAKLGEAMLGKAKVERV